MSTRGRWLVNLALLAVVGLLAAVVIWRPGEKPAPQPYRLSTLEADKVNSIRIEQAGKPTVVLARQKQGWRLTAPFSARAAKFRVDAILKLTAATSETRFAAADRNLSDFGLKPPKVTVWLDDEAFQLGANHPLENKRYVMHDGRIFLVPGAVLWSTEASDFADTELFEPGSRLTGLRLPDFSLRLVEGRWKREPEDPKLSADALTRFADAWRLARALTVNPSEGGESQGSIEVDVTAPGAKPATVTFDILAKKDGLTLYRPDEHLEYHLAPGSSKRMLTITAK